MRCIAARLASGTKSSRFSAACAYAAVGQIDRALEQVSRAIEHEYEHAEKMETDPDLDAVRKDKRFAELLKRLESQKPDPG